MRSNFHIRVTGSRIFHVCLQDTPIKTNHYNVIVHSHPKIRYASYLISEFHVLLNKYISTYQLSSRYKHNHLTQWVFCYNFWGHLRPVFIFFRDEKFPRKINLLMYNSFGCLPGKFKLNSVVNVDFNFLCLRIALSCHGNTLAQMIICLETFNSGLCGLLFSYCIFTPLWPLWYTLISP